MNHKLCLPYQIFEAFEGEAGLSPVQLSSARSMSDPFDTITFKSL